MSNQNHEPVLSLPKGGGAIRGIGETFQPNPFSGTGNFTIPIFTSPGREGFGPKLELNYSTGNGNGWFGLGWDLAIPRVTRKTEKGLPRYDEFDVFVLSGSEDLVVQFKPGTAQPDVFSSGTYTVTRYRPRTEGLFSRIEKWVRSDGDIHWRSVTRGNVTSIYGLSPASRICDPDRPERIHQWLLEESFDARGDHILYEYARDDPQLQLSGLHEKNRVYAQVYPRRIHYGNLPDPLTDGHGDPVTYADGSKIGVERAGTDHNDPLQPKKRRYAFEVVFDYFDWNEPSPDRTQPTVPAGSYAPPPAPGQQELFDHTVPVRPDPFSSFRGGFELRTLRRCRRVLMVHHFKELGGPTPVKATNFDYETNAMDGLSFLKSVVVTGFRKSAGGFAQRSRPPVTLAYSEFKPGQQQYRSIEAEGNDFPDLPLNHPDVALVDLFGDGLPDIVQTTDDGFHYWRNLGNGRLDRRHAMHEAPVGVRLSDPGVAFGDMGGDGMADLLVHHPEAASGFYEMTMEGGWNRSAFKHYHQVPSIGFSDPNARLVDLTGDGLTDILVTADHHFLWLESKGEEGYAAPQAVPRIPNVDRFPHVFFDDASGRVRLADMTGDGLEDIVLIHSGRIDYWPNLGYGKFGTRITMSNAPWLDPNFEPSRMFLVDLGGSGVADLVYVEYGRVLCWFNQAGNRWSDPVVINGTPPVSDADSVRFADFFGTGTRCLIWNRVLHGPGESPLKVLDFSGGIKPNLLVEMDSNMGMTTRVRYASSTTFFLKDREAGDGWFTPLPFPVQVVEKTETIDHVGQTKLVTRYRYHHGYYDGQEREFRGFGRVDRFDTETFEAFTQQGLHTPGTTFVNTEKAFHLPPVETRTWYHTGLFRDENLSPDGSVDHDALLERYRKEYYAGDPKAFAVDDHQVETGSSPREAFRTMRGALLRREVYSRDGTTTENHPYAVEESVFLVRQVQPWAGNLHTVYQVLPREQIRYTYERNPADPRILHTLTVEVDDFGNILKQLTMAYPRRTAVGGQPAAEQKSLKTVFTWNRFINEPNQTTFYYVGVPCETRQYEITGKPVGWNAQRLLTAADFTPALSDPGSFKHFEEQPANLGKRLLKWTQGYFRKDAAIQKVDAPDVYTHRLPHGRIERLGLLYESYEAVFSGSLLQGVYRNRATLERLDRGGYIPSSRLDVASFSWPAQAGVDQYWWRPSGKKGYESAPAGFYQVCESRDVFGNKFELTRDPYRVATVHTKDVVENQTFVDVDYRVLQPSTLTDANGNLGRVAYDTLGFVAATSAEGKNGEGDSLTAVEVDLPQKTISEQLNFPLGNHFPGETPPRTISPHDVLGGATTRILYDINAFYEKGQPVAVHVLSREMHGSELAAGTQSRIQHRRLYSDGFGREVQAKALVAPASGTSGQPRWIASGSNTYNNKGKPVRRFEPFFSDTPAFGLEQHGVSSTVFYDPLSRAVMTLHPNRTYEKTVFTPWEQMTWDANDTLHPFQRYDAVNDKAPDLQFNPANDPHVGFYFSGLPAAAYLPTWYKTRLDPAEALAEWPDNDSTGQPLPGNAERRAAEKRAALKASRHASTPGRTLLDNLGRLFRETADNGDDATGVPILLTVTRESDISGNERKITDARRVETHRQDFDMVGRVLAIDSADAGKRRVLPDVKNKLVFSVDANGHETETFYDALRRSTEVWVKETGSNPPFLAEKMVYGEEKGDQTDPNDLPEKTNHRGKVWKIYDGAGLVENLNYDFRGNLTSSRRTLLAAAKLKVQWAVHGQPGTGHFDPAQAAQKLDAAHPYTMRTAFDALGRVVENEAPDGSIQKNGFDEAGGLNTVEVVRPAATQSFVEAVHYDARGRRQRIHYGNGVRTVYTYDPITFRLDRLHSSRAVDGSLVQDLNYVYDPVGNITEVRDGAVKTVYYKNQVIDPVSRFTYDPLYRLVEAEGREHESLSACHYRPGFQNQTEFIPFDLQPVSNLSALTNYHEAYEYDASGNITKMIHRTVRNGAWEKQWERTQAYEVDDPGLPENRQTPVSNRIRTSDAGCPGERAFTFRHDANGNVRSLPHLHAVDGTGLSRDCLHWDFLNQLVNVDLNQSGDRAYYQYDAQGNRIRKFVERGGVTEERIYLGGFEIYHRKGGTLSEVKRFTQHVMDDQSGIALIEDEKDHLAHPLGNTRIRFQLSNHLGSAALELDDTIHARVISYEEYSPYGRTTFTGYPNGTGARERAGRKRYRYCGKERDEETGMYYYGARYYAPWLGRWLSCDPAGATDGTNLFRFVRANPISHIDSGGTGTMPPVLSPTPVPPTPPPVGPLNQGTRLGWQVYRAIVQASAMEAGAITASESATVFGMGPVGWGVAAVGVWGFNAFMGYEIYQKYRSLQKAKQDLEYLKRKNAEAEQGLQQEDFTLPGPSPATSPVTEPRSPAGSPRIAPGRDKPTPLEAPSTGSKSETIEDPVTPESAPMKTTPEKGPRGGAHKVTKQQSEQFKRESDHMPPKSVTKRVGISEGDSPAVSKEYEVHRNARSTGSSHEAQDYRDALLDILLDPNYGLQDAALADLQSYIDQEGIENVDTEAILQWFEYLDGEFQCNHLPGQTPIYRYGPTPTTTTNSN